MWSPGISLGLVNCCITSRTERTRSTPSPARNASNWSDTTDWDNAIGGTSWVSTCRYTPRIPSMAQHQREPYRPPETPPLQGTLTSLTGHIADLEVE